MYRLFAGNFFAQNFFTKVFKNEVNSGAAVTRNNCLDKATGEYVAFLDSDDLWAAEKLQKQLDFAQQNNAEFVYHNYWIVDSEANQIKKQILPASVSQSQLLNFNPFATSSVMIKRDVIEKNKIRFREHLRRRQDYLFWYEVIGQSEIALGMPELLSSYRIFGKDSLSANKKQMAKIQWQLYRQEFKLGLFASAYYFVRYAIHGIKKYFF